MRKIHYALIGTVPTVEEFRDNLQELLDDLEHEREHDSRRLEAATTAYLIEQCAEHFYGFKLEAGEKIDDLVDDMRNLDSTLMFH